MKGAKRKIIEGIERQNQEWLRNLGKKENYKYLGILEDTIKEAKMKRKKDYF